MLAKFTRIIIVVVFTLFTLTWLFGGNKDPIDRASAKSYVSEQHDSPPAEPQQRPTKVHYADIPDKSSKSTKSSSSYVPAPTGSPMFERKSPFGYVFYATSDEFACAALINMNTLKNFHTKHRMFALVTEKVNKGYRDAMEELNVTVSVTPAPMHPHRRNNIKEGSLLKLLAFKMHHIDKSLKRVIVLDADQYIYKPLDSLFGLPSADFAAPRAYWRGNHLLSTTLMVISLSDRLWRQVEDGMKKLKETWFDFELVNELFEGSAMVLPGQYGMVDDHFVNWDLPAWYRPEGDINNEGMVKEYSKAKLADLWKVLEANTATKPKEIEPQAPVAREPVPVKDLKKRSNPKMGDDMREVDMGEILTPEQAKKEEEKANKDESNNKPPQPQQQPKAEEKKPEERIPEPTHDDAEEHKREVETKAAEAKAAEVRAAEARVAEGKAAEAKAAEGQAAEVKAAEARAAEARAAEARNEQIRREQAQRAAREKAEEERNRNKPPPHPYSAETHPNRGPLEHLWNQAAVMHYGKVLKPWEKDYDAYRNERPDMHPRIYETHRVWREDSQRYCPRVDKEIPEDRRLPDDPATIRFHLVNNV